MAKVLPTFQLFPKNSERLRLFIVDNNLIMPYNLIRISIDYFTIMKRLAMALELVKMGTSEIMEFKTESIRIRFLLNDKKISLLSILPSGVAEIGIEDASSVNSPVKIQECGRGKTKLSMCGSVFSSPGSTMLFSDLQKTKTSKSLNVVLSLTDQWQSCQAKAEYELMDCSPVIRCRTSISNISSAAIGIESLSSAVIYNISSFNNIDSHEDVRIYIPNSAWCAEGQWEIYTPEQLGLCQNFKKLNQGNSACEIENIGSFSSCRYLPMGVIENKTRKLSYFWQIEYSGSWRVEFGEMGKGLYMVAGGATEKSGGWYEELDPGASFMSIPVAIGVVNGGFEDAIEALTDYRRKVLAPIHKQDSKLPVFFNDYMNGLMGEPDEIKEKSYIEAAAKTGSEYFVIDAGWYANIKEDWWPCVGDWCESPQRFPNYGLKGICNLIRDHGMKPGLWVEIEAVGINSEVAKNPDSWFFRRHGRRVVDNGRYFFDFRNQDVRNHTRGIIDRLILDYGIEYIKIDYNINSGLGTDHAASSPFSGQLGHIRAYYGWLEEIRKQYPDLIIENCGSGGMRMDYGMLSHTDVQSLSDQEDMRFFPSIVSGCLANVLPEQAMGWAFPQKNYNLNETVFTLTTVMASRFLLGGQIDAISPQQMALVKDAIAVYKSIRNFISESYVFWPNGFTKTSEQNGWVVFGLRDKKWNQAIIYYWRLASDTGKFNISIDKLKGKNSTCTGVFPSDIEGFSWQDDEGALSLELPEQYSSGIVQIKGLS